MNAVWTAATLVAALTAANAAALPPHSYTNHLAGQSSRYLQQHAANPVDWYPWGEAAFAKAKQENKPVFLSIGYSTCHWCHVMEQESFSDAETAKLMNDAFVSIKVDREERPDLDAVYLAVTRNLTGEAGWPNNVILTPDGKPFYAASYVPREKFRVLIPRLSSMWREQRERVVANADLIVRSLRASPAEGDALDATVLKKGYEQLAARFDAANGGFLPEPKFPTPHHLMFLLRYWNRTKDAKALAMVETTLRAMRASKLWDAKNLGFHRYASDAKWNEPHYEKMLYDQALLALAYLEAWQVTRKDEYAQTARDIFRYVLRDLRSPGGAFYAAQDPDGKGRDEKLIADWNGLMIAALAYGANVLDEPAYAAAATRAADAIYDKRRRFLDDDAFLAWGLLNLYEATFDVRHLQRAIALTDESVKLFRDAGGRFYITASDAEALLVRPRETGDRAIPAGNSVMLMNLIRVARITAKPQYDTYANELLRGVSDEVSLAPSTATYLLTALDFVLGPSYEIVLAGKDVSAMKRAVFTPFVPNKIVLRRDDTVAAIAPYTDAQRAIGGKATAYVCTNYMCKLPVTDAKAIGTLLSR